MHYYGTRQMNKKCLAIKRCASVSYVYIFILLILINKTLEFPGLISWKQLCIGQCKYTISNVAVFKLKEFNNLSNIFQGTVTNI